MAKPERRDPEKESLWRSRMREYEGSGLSARAYSQTTSSGATETISLASTIGNVQANYNNVNELVSLAAGGATRYQGTTNKAIKSGSVSTQLVSINAAAPNPTAYAGSTNAGATETITLGTNIDGNATATIAGTVTAGNVLTLTVYNASLSGGQASASYTVLSGDTLTSIATGLKNAINAITGLTAIGLSATSSSAIISLAVTRPTYTVSTSAGAKETITLGTNNSGTTTATIGGIPTTNDTLTITTHYPGLTGGQEPVTYTVLSGDTLIKIAAGLVALINGDTHLQGIGLSGANSTNLTLNWSENFTGNPPLTGGTNTTALTTVDGGNNQVTSNYQVSAQTTGSTSLTFDADGNMTSDGTNTYQWDAENRLIQINYPGTGNNSQFVYDGWGHNVKTLEYSGGSLASTKQFVWCKNDRCEARNASGTITAQYFAYGETISGTSYYYTRDHLGFDPNQASKFGQLTLIPGLGNVWNPCQSGSIREMTDSSGNIQASFNYDPYGRATQLQGSLSSDFQYAGYYYHAPSGLNLTITREYSASIGRWISRDPMEETFSVNLYSYVDNNPAAWADPSGLTGKPNSNPSCPPLQKQTPLYDWGGGQTGTNPPPPPPPLVAPPINNNPNPSPVPPPFPFTPMPAPHVPFFI